ncbi:MAG TPA: DoxX family protein [Thermoanaerobaculia bacterium]|nr:DoxX family protein [Thermoanaerobaculia bacterium]
MTVAPTAPVSKGALWTGRILSAIPVLMMLMGAAMTFFKPEMATEGIVKYGYPAGIVLYLGITELVCALLYAIPRTSVLGAILLTGYLGGATATHVRIGEANWFVPVLFGVVVWLGLYLRDSRLRALVPLRS